MSEESLLTLAESRAAREASGTFFAEGIGFVFQARQAGFRCQQLAVCAELLRDPVGQRLSREFERDGVPVIRVSAEVMRKLARRTEPQGIGGVFLQRWQALRHAHPSQGLCWLAVPRLQSPGNLGTLLRTLAAVGGAGLICLGDDADPYDPAVVRPTMGAVFRQAFVRTSPHRLAQWASRHNVRLIGTSPRGTIAYDRYRFRGPSVLCVGHEREGLTPEELALCDDVLQIPMQGPQDSLNVAIAGSIVLYEMYRQRRSALSRRRR